MEVRTHIIDKENAVGNKNIPNLKILSGIFRLISFILLFDIKLYFYNSLKYISLTLKTKFNVDDYSTDKINFSF